MKLLKDKVIVPFAVSGVIVALAGLLLWQLALDAPLRALGSVLAPASAFAVGMLGLFLFGSEGFVREDSFLMMYILMSLGLIIFGLGEVATSLISLLEQPQIFYFTIGLIQLPGLFLWTVGFLRYLWAVNDVLEYSEGRRLLATVLITSAALVIILLVIAMMGFAPHTFFELVTSIPIAAGFAIITCTLAALFWSFREGQLAVPLALSLLGAILLLIRGFFWCCIGLSPLEPLSQILAIEAYILFGGSATRARHLSRSD